MIWHPSPNFGPRRDGLRPQFVVLHYTAMDTAEAALVRLCDPEAEVSAHYLISNSGTLWQMVREEDRAWHAGAGEWRGLSDINSRSIGIELDNRGTHPFSEAQMAVLDRLLAGILSRWALPPEAVIAHSDLAPGRKGDPGARFDWARLALQSLAAPTPKARAGQGGDLEAALVAAGYSAPVSCEDRLAAFRLRHRPQASGPASPEDHAILEALAQAQPLDRTAGHA